RLRPMTAMPITPICCFAISFTPSFIHSFCTPLAQYPYFTLFAVERKPLLSFFCSVSQPSLRLAQLVQLRERRGRSLVKAAERIMQPRVEGGPGRVGLAAVRYGRAGRLARQAVRQAERPEREQRGADCRAVLAVH